MEAQEANKGYLNALGRIHRGEKRPLTRREKLQRRLVPLVAATLVSGGVAANAATGGGVVEQLKKIPVVGEILDNDRTGEYINDKTYKGTLVPYETEFGKFIDPILREAPDKNRGRIISFLDLENNGFRTLPELDVRLVFGSPYKGPGKGVEQKEARRTAKQWGFNPYWNFNLEGTRDSHYGVWARVTLRNERGQTKTAFTTINFLRKTTPPEANQSR